MMNLRLISRHKEGIKSRDGLSADEFRFSARRQADGARSAVELLNAAYSSFFVIPGR
jgi:hypothetical protein